MRRNSLLSSDLFLLLGFRFCQHLSLLFKINMGKQILKKGKKAYARWRKEMFLSKLHALELLRNGRVPVVRDSDETVAATQLEYTRFLHELWSTRA